MLDYTCVPEHMRGGLRRYIEDGVQPGSFLASILANDFVGAIGRADHVNFACLKDWALFLYNELPGRGHHDPDCWGSADAVRNWIKIGGLKGIGRAQDEPNE